MLEIDSIPEYVPWTYGGMTYDLKVEIERLPIADEVAKGNDDDMTGRDGEHQDDTMDHDKCDDIPKSAGQPTQTVDAPADKGTVPSSMPMAGLRFGSFWAALAPCDSGGTGPRLRTQLSRSRPRCRR